MKMYVLFQLNVLPQTCSTLKNRNCDFCLLELVITILFCKTFWDYNKPNFIDAYKTIKFIAFIFHIPLISEFIGLF